MYATSSISSGHYHQLTWSIRHWHLKHRRLMSPDGLVPRTIMTLLPSGRTTFPLFFAQRIRFMMPHLASTLVPFSITARVKSWRFRALRHRQSTLEYVVKHILCECDHPGTKACHCDTNPATRGTTPVVGYGAAKFDPCARGNAPAPNARISRALERLGHAIVVPIDEFRSSKLGSFCHRELSPLPHTRPSGYHGTLQCTNYDCRAHGKPWNRDVNAAINMASLLLFSQVRTSSTDLPISREALMSTRPYPLLHLNGSIVIN